MYKGAFVQVLKFRFGLVTVAVSAASHDRVDEGIATLMKNIGTDNRSSVVARSILLSLTTAIALFLASCVTKQSSQSALRPGQELKPAGEDETIQNIITLLSTQLERQYSAPNESFLRDTHPKSDGCLKAEFKVQDGIPAAYKHGIFAVPTSYKAWLRFSNSAPEVTPDIDRDFRGLAIKLFGVEGERLPLPGDEQHTQDFLFVAFPAFFAGNPADFFDFFDKTFNGGRLGSLEYFATRPQALKNTLQGRQRFGNPLDITWFSVAPFLLGQRNSDGSGLAVKYKIKSCVPREDSIPEDPDYNYLRAAMERRLATEDQCLWFLVQPQGDPQAMPIEDTLTAWDEEKAPFIPVAQITIPKQTFSSPAQREFCENLSFNPWHGLQVHQPLGGINRARKVVMKALSDLRLTQRGMTRREPTGLETFP
jgi:hypothetical protein